VKLDPSQIDQILANLCINARDAIAGNGKLTISTENVLFDEADCMERAEIVPGEYVKMTFSDTGCGMDKETVNSIFEPFFTTKGLGKGTGLGLATVYGIVKQNNGFINVYSEPGLGTTFKIYLPSHRFETELALMQDIPEKIAWGHETILLVEDDPSVLRMTTKLLERLGYMILPAGTPSEAIHLAEAHAGQIHLLMTDVIMPEMNGLELAKSLLRDHPHLKKVFVSGYTADVIARHGVLNEGIHFIQKPLSSRTLSSKLREVLDGCERGSTPPVPPNPMKEE
jgi:CheY-like chemotaxis protein